MNIDKTTTSAGLFLVACAACCAPLIAPPIIAAIAADDIGLVLVGQLGLALVIVAAGGLCLLSRRKAPSNATFQSLMAQGECGCGPACASKAYQIGFVLCWTLQRAMMIGKPGSSIIDLVTPPKIRSRSRE
jgi:hypothetical protein